MTWRGVVDTIIRPTLGPNARLDANAQRVWWWGNKAWHRCAETETTSPSSKGGSHQGEGWPNSPLVGLLLGSGWLVVHMNIDASHPCWCPSSIRFSSVDTHTHTYIHRKTLIHPCCDRTLLQQT